MSFNFNPMENAKVQGSTQGAVKFFYTEGYNLGFWNGWSMGLGTMVFASCFLPASHIEIVTRVIMGIVLFGSVYIRSSVTRKKTQDIFNKHKKED